MMSINWSFSKNETPSPCCNILVSVTFNLLPWVFSLLASLVATVVSQSCSKHLFDIIEDTACSVIKKSTSLLTCWFTLVRHTFTSGVFTAQDPSVRSPFEPSRLRFTFKSDLGTWISSLSSISYHNKLGNDHGLERSLLLANPHSVLLLCAFPA